MATPVINTDTSVFAFTRGHYYSIAFSATESPTSWAMTSGGIPDGMTFSTSEGTITGTPNRDSEGSVFTFTLTATDGVDTSTEATFTIGVERPSSEPDGSMELSIDLRTQKLLNPGSTEVDEKGRPIIHAKSGDVFPLTLAFRKGGSINSPAVEIGCYAITVTAKEFEPEATAFTLNEVGVWTLGSYDRARYVTKIDLSAAALETVLSNYEADDDTYVDMPCEIQYDFRTTDASSNDIECTRTTRTFILRLHRDLA